MSPRRSARSARPARLRRVICGVLTSLLPGSLPQSLAAGASAGAVARAALTPMSAFCRRKGSACGIQRRARGPGRPRWIPAGASAGVVATAARTTPLSASCRRRGCACRIRRIVALRAPASRNPASSLVPPVWSRPLLRRLSVRETAGASLSGAMIAFRCSVPAAPVLTRAALWPDGPATAAYRLPDRASRS